MVNYALFSLVTVATLGREVDTVGSGLHNGLQYGRGSLAPEHARAPLAATRVAPSTGGATNAGSAALHLNEI